jgi:hypothetical protein
VREIQERTDRLRIRYHDRYTQHGAFIAPEDNVEAYAFTAPEDDVDAYPSRGDANLWMVKTNVRITFISLSHWFTHGVSADQRPPPPLRSWMREWITKVL